MPAKPEAQYEVHPVYDRGVSLKLVAHAQDLGALREIAGAYLDSHHPSDTKSAKAEAEELVTAIVNREWEILFG